MGPDRNAAKSAMSVFLAEGTYTANQIRFVNIIIDNGIMEPKRLFEPPFTDLDDQGVAGMMGDDAETIIEAIQEINANIVPV